MTPSPRVGQPQPWEGPGVVPPPPCLSFLHDLGPEPEGDAEGAETRHLAAGVLANVLLQLAYYTATEAQQLEAYAWVSVC